MTIKNRPNIKPKGLSLYLFLSFLIHAVIFAWLYHFNLLQPPQEPVDPIPVEIIAHGESPTYAQVALKIQPRIPNKKSPKIRNLTFQPDETGEFDAASLVSLGKKPEPEIILPAIPDEPVSHYLDRDAFSARQIKSTATTTVHRSYWPHWPVLPNPPDQTTPLTIEAPYSMVTTGLDYLTTIHKKSVHKISSRVETIPRPSPVRAKHFSNPLTDPADRIPSITVEREMIRAKLNTFPLRPDQQTIPGPKPKVISPAILKPKPAREWRHNLPILAPDTELAALDMNYPPSFPLPGSPEGAIFLLAIDTSGSVKGAPLKGIKKSAHDFVNLMGPKDLAEIITFDDSVRKTGSFTANKGALHEKIDALQPTGSMTVLYDALLDAHEMIEKTDHKNRFIVLFSDGKDEGSQATLEKAITPLRRSDISILAVGYTRVEKKYLKILGTVAGKTGGIFVQTPQFRDMMSLYRLSHPADTTPRPVGSITKKPIEKVDLASLAGQIKAFKKSQDASFIRLWTQKKVYKIGDSIGYHFQSSQDCHLIVILFSSSGEIVQIFPNRYHPDSFISTGITYNTPSPDSDIKLEVTGPPGKEELVAIISDTPLKVFPFNPEEVPFFVVDGTDLLLLKRIHDNIQLAKKKDFKHKGTRYAIER